MISVRLSFTLVHNVELIMKLTTFLPVILAKFWEVALNWGVKHSSDMINPECMVIYATLELFSCTKATIANHCSALSLR